MDNTQSIGTTTLDSLPAGASGENIQLTTKEISQNTVVTNPVKEVKKEREIDQNELISGIQKAAASGATGLPSRDIPIDTSTIVQDVQTKPNYVPSGPSDYITEHQTSDEIVKQNARMQKQSDQFDNLYAEISLPLLIAVLYFMYDLPAVRKMFLNTLPMCYGKSGDINLYGRLINCLMFGAIIYASSKLVSQLAR